jgi:hypoxanthine phosphoribosyltransferase
MTILTICLGVLSVLGTAGTFYFGWKAGLLQRLRNSLTWQQVASGSLYLLREAEKQFRPDILLTTSGPGAIVANLAMSQARKFYPIYTIILEDRRSGRFKLKPKGHEELFTPKWVIHLPEQLCQETDKRILIIDDCVMSGDVQRAICEFLEAKGFPKKKIFFATLVCSQIATETEKAPNLYWQINSHKDLFFPWGRWF